jgi:hypothetical protein
LINEISYDIEDMDEGDNNEESLIQIFDIVTELYDTNIIKAEDLNAFLFYYMPETLIDIEKLSMSSIKIIRKISYRELEKKSSMNYQKIRRKVIKVRKLVKQKIDSTLLYKNNQS